MVVRGGPVAHQSLAEGYHGRVQDLKFNAQQRLQLTSTLQLFIFRCVALPINLTDKLLTLWLPTKSTVCSIVSITSP